LEPDAPADELERPARMDLICYLHPGWAPLIRPAPATRYWMDQTPESFAYRCLPLNIANAHGWEVLNPFGFEAVWDGGTGVEAVTIRHDPGVQPERAAVSLFGQGILTFHIEGLIRTPPGWNLWVSGSPNRFKDAIAPLGGVIETDWSPFTFTMNWRFTRPHTPVRFEAMEPFCFMMPVQTAATEAFEPRFEPIDAEPDLASRFADWSRSRDEFHRRMRDNPPAVPADRWQKHYYRGVDSSEQAIAPDHRTKVRLKPFDRKATPQVAAPPVTDAAAPAPPAGGGEIDRLKRDLAKREWLLETLERQRDLAPATMQVERRAGLSADEFLGRYYAVNRPVILTGEMTDWPALTLWTPDYLKARVGSRPIQYQGERSNDPRFEMDKDAHRREEPFDAFIDRIQQPGAGNNAYITAYNSAGNAQALAPLTEDQRPLDRFLDPNGGHPNGMMWIGPAGTFTALHHDLTNNLIAQVVGRKRILLLPAAEVGRLYNHQHVFSELTDLENIPDLGRYPRLPGVRAYQIDLEPGEILFVPLAWWHQVKALDFSVTLTYTNFRWPNDAAQTYPQG
jgi:hypothetical protein